VKRDGSLWAWGDNRSGQLGLGDERERLAPTRVDGASDWASTSAGGNHSVAVKSDGSLWAWGWGSNGRLGLGDYRDRFTPTRVGEASTWATASAHGEHCLALQRDGSLWAWGDNKYGVFGVGDEVRSRLGPTRVGEANDWAMASAGGDCSLALKRDGTLWAWGMNAYFRLGLGHPRRLSVPTQVKRGSVGRPGFHVG
jgi:alpha-tubulin suppressor-like RCC1 family protein